MAHYAFLDKNNVVTEVITGIDETELIEGLHPEIWYGNFRNQKCLRTSYNTYANKHKENGTPFRKNYAGIGYVYDEIADAFIPPRPFPSWKLNYESFQWEAPIPEPILSNDEKLLFDYIWSEPNQEWVKLPL
jgi:hypothetical protein